VNIDERLEKLTARHEALAQILEILTHGLADFKTTTAEAITGLRDSVSGLGIP